MEIKTQLMDSAQMARSITRITHEIIEKNWGLEDICFVGIKRRGIPLAWRLAETAYRFENVQIPVGYVDISLYRDDMTEVTELPESAGSQFPIDVNGKTVVLVDRGHRELPIKPDYVGKNVPTSHEEHIRVLMTEVDGTDGVFICEKSASAEPSAE